MCTGHFTVQAIIQYDVCADLKSLNGGMWADEMLNTPLTILGLGGSQDHCCEGPATGAVAYFRDRSKHQQTRLDELFEWFRSCVVV